MHAVIAMRPAVFVLLAGLCAVACGRLLGIEAPQDADEPDGGSAGQSGGGAGGVNGSGGETPTNGGTSGTGASGGATPGSGGRTNTGGAGNGAADGGDAGTPIGGAGAGGDASPPGPVLGEPCDGDETSCSPLNRTIVLRCSAGVWELLSTCNNNELCDASIDTCNEVHHDCLYPWLQCKGPQLRLDCDTNPFGQPPPQVVCPFGCLDGRCLPGGEDDLVVHPEVLPPGSFNRWENVIPVCVRGLEGNEGLVAIIRDESERSWGRYLNLEFTGFMECADPADGARVELEFVDDCVSRLVLPVPLGGKSIREEPTRVGICRTYWDNGDDLRHLIHDVELLRFVTRHQLGHVLGNDDSYGFVAKDAMAQGLTASDAGQLVLTNNLLNNLNYPNKPSGTLVTTSGACLSADESGLRALPCSHLESGPFDIVDGSVTSRPLQASCLVADQNGGRLEPCDAGGTKFAFQRLRWSTPELCVAPRSTSTGSSVEAASCGRFGEPMQTWDFETLGRDGNAVRARLSPSGTDHCLTVSRTQPERGDIPRLEPCNDLAPEQEFLLWSNGNISVSDWLCLGWDPPGSVLYFDTCYDTYWFSGTLETSDHRVLTRIADTVDFEVRELAADATPGLDQIFDFAF